MPWVIDEASKRAFEHFQNHDEVEMVIRNLKKQYAPFENLKIKWVDEVKEKTFDQNTIRKMMRNMQKDSAKLDQIIPKLDQIFTPLQNVQILSILNTALSAANFIATVAGMVVICEKLNSLDHKLDDIQKEIAAVKEITYETQIAQQCRSLMDDYKLLTPSLSKGRPVSEEKLFYLIRGCKDNIISVYNLRNSLPLDTVLSLIFMLLPVMANIMMVYYQRFFDPDQEKHPLHDSCMSVFDLLSSPDFIDQIQDNLFIVKNQTNRQVNEYLDCHRLIVYSYRKQIEELLEDLKACGSKENYSDAMQWCRQYVAQQARVVEAELESKIGAERAREYIEQAMQEAAIA